LQEAEGREDATGNPQVKALESELHQYEDPDFEKAYSPIRKPHATNDYGVPLASNYHSVDDDDDPRNVELSTTRSQLQGQSQSHGHGSHRHHEHGRGQASSVHSHHKHHHHSHKNAPHHTPPNPNVNILEALQLDQGVNNEYADPADDS